MPWQKFSQVNVPKETNYSESYNWIVHPDTLDLGKFLPQKTQISATRSDVAVFFIHPTTYINRNNWNQPPNDPEANEILRKRILVNQASIFSACCEVYVPRYRQATLSSFAALNYNKVNAFSVAYKDILNSFKYFDENFRKKRPFIIASHSQGSMHAVKLLNNLKPFKALTYSSFFNGPTNGAQNSKLLASTDSSSRPTPVSSTFFVNRTKSSGLMAKVLFESSSASSTKTPPGTDFKESYSTKGLAVANSVAAQIFEGGALEIFCGFVEKASAEE